MQFVQRALWCSCGLARIHALGLCRRCYWAHQRSRRNFGGLRRRALERDGACVLCGERREERLVVHHRRPGRNQLPAMATLCRACHAKVHHLRREWFGMPEDLRALWLEAHPRQARQLELVFGASPVQRRLFEPAA